MSTAVISKCTFYPKVTDCPNCLELPSRNKLPSWDCLFLILPRAQIKTHSPSFHTVRKLPGHWPSVSNNSYQDYSTFYFFKFYRVKQLWTWCQTNQGWKANGKIMKYENFSDKICGLRRHDSAFFVRNLQFWRKTVFSSFTSKVVFGSRKHFLFSPAWKKSLPSKFFFLVGGLKLSDRRDCQDILSCNVRADFKVLMRASLSKDFLLSHLLSQSFLFEKAPFTAWKYLHHRWFISRNNKV